jgi:hypothetical protein
MRTTNGVVTVRLVGGMTLIGLNRLQFVSESFEFLSERFPKLLSGTDDEEQKKINVRVAHVDFPYAPASVDDACFAFRTHAYLMGAGRNIVVYTLGNQDVELVHIRCSSDEQDLCEVWEKIKVHLIISGSAPAITH